LASRADEGRGNAAISLGQVRATVTGDFRMGQPTGFHHPVPYRQSITIRRQPGELKHLTYPEEERSFP
jgi:hypothetical protein